MFRIFQIALRSGWENPSQLESDILLRGRGVYRVKGTWGGMILAVQTFFKAETASCEYWTSIKFKSNMTCVSTEYETKTKMKQDRWPHLKILFFMGYNLKIAVHWWWWWRRRGGIDICLREIKIWWSGGGRGGGAYWVWKFF